MHAGERGSGNLEMFGSLLRFYRERAGMTQETLGGYVQYSKSQVAMVERGERAPKGQFATIADEVLGAQGALLAAASKLKPSSFPSWFEDYVDLEAKASAIYMYACHMVPGLLQTPSYARAVFGNHWPAYEDDELEARLAARLERQRVLQRKPTPVVGFVLEEHILRRPIGGRQNLREQVAHILDVSQRRNVVVQVMPTDRETHAGVNNPLILLETDDHARVAWFERPGGGTFAEQPHLSNVFAQYGLLRAQALNPDESAKLIDKVASEL